MGKKCVVSFADKAGDYQAKMKRLEESLKGNFDGDFLGFTDYKEIGCKPHSVVPYQFKPYAIWKAIEMGYETILWLDSPIVATKNIMPVFDYIEENGYMFFRNIGHPLGKWSHDKALNHFEVTREEAMNIDQTMASCQGFCISPSKGHSFSVRELILRPYKDLSDDLYPGSWENSRHDQMVISFLIHKHGFRILNGHETFFAYTHFSKVFAISDSVCLMSV